MRQFKVTFKDISVCLTLPGLKIFTSIFTCDWAMHLLICHNDSCMGEYHFHELSLRVLQTKILNLLLSEPVTL